MDSETFKYQPCEIKDNKIEALLRRMSFQVAEDYSKIFCIEQGIPYEIHLKLEKYSTLGQEVLIGKGSFGNVYLTKHLKLNVNCALKVHHNISDEELLYQTNEYVIQGQLNQINNNLFVKSIDKIYIKQQEVNNYTTFAGLELGVINLYCYLIQVQINEQEFESIYYSILESIMTMHENHYAHRDIKPQNILYVEKKGWVLSDFGCSMKYKSVESKFEICGTKAFLPKKYRKLQNYNFASVSTDMNLFLIDIHAFQMTLLQILNPKAQINQLQDIIDNCLPYHPLIDVLYNKSFEQVQLIRKPTYQRIQAQKVDSVVQKTLLFQESQSMSEVQKIKNIFKRINIVSDNLENPIDLQRLIDELKQLFQQCTVENQTYIKIFLASLFNIKLDLDISSLQINDSTKTWQYKIIQHFLNHLGHIDKQYENCIKFQKLRNKTNIKYKIEQIEVAQILGYKAAAKTTLSEIEDKAYYCDDINYLKYYYYKANLNNEWWEIQEEVISYFKHISQSEFLMAKIFPEIHYLKNQQEDIYDYIYDDNEYQDYSTLDSYQLELLILDKWLNYDSEKLGILLKHHKLFLYSKYPTTQSFVQEMKNIGHQNYSLSLELSRMAFHYQVAEQFELALGVYGELLNLLDDNSLSNTIFPIYMNYAILLEELGNLEAALEYALKAAQNIKQEGIFFSIQCSQLIWYIKVQLFDEDCVDNFASLMDLYKQFKGKKIKFGLIKRVYYGFQQLVKRGSFDIYEKHLALLEDCIGDQDHTLKSPDYSYFLHILRWDLYYYQRKFSLLLIEYNHFLNIIQTCHIPFDARVLQLQQNLASLGYYEQNITDAQKIQLFSKNLQSLIIQADLFSLDENVEVLSRRFALNQYIFANQHHLKNLQIGARIGEQLNIESYINQC